MIRRKKPTFRPILRKPGKDPVGTSNVDSSSTTASIDSSSATTNVDSSSTTTNVDSSLTTANVDSLSTTANVDSVLTTPSIDSSLTTVNIGMNNSIQNPSPKKFTANSLTNAVDLSTSLLPSTSIARSTQVEPGKNESKTQEEKKPKTVTRRKKMFVAPNIGKSVSRFSSKRSNAKESEVLPDTTSSVSSNFKPEHTHTPISKTNKCNSPNKNTIDFIETAEKADAITTLELIDTVDLSNVSPTPTSPHKSLINDQSCAISGIDSICSNSNNTSTKPNSEKINIQSSPKKNNLLLSSEKSNLQSNPEKNNMQSNPEKSNLQTNLEKNNLQLSSEKTSDGLSSPESKKKPGLIISIPSRNINKTKQQLFREQLGYEPRLHRHRRALKKLKSINLEKSNENGEEWSSLVRDSLLISDLIYCNPPAGSAKELGLTATLRKMKEKEVEAEKNNSLHSQSSSQTVAAVRKEPNETENNVIAPQIRLNEDGSLVIDEESLVINSSNNDTVVRDTPAVYENEFSKVNHVNFRRFPIAKRSLWTSKQTEKFYRALQIVGTDFGLMRAMFRKRTDSELRRKYHLEKKKNSSKVDEALKHQHLTKWTDDMFMAFSSSDEEIDKPKKKRRKRSKSSRSKANLVVNNTEVNS